jgi:hypothetical protein
MDRDFTGDPKLLKRYTEIVTQLPAAYRSGASICFAGAHGLGKQLDLNTDIPTPTGFIKLIDLKEGDQLFDENGEICNVTKLHPINISPESYEITFDDGSKVKACADHLWLTRTRQEKLKNIQGSVRSTKDILNTLKFFNYQRMAANHSIVCAKPIQYSEKKLPIDPYVLGCWLGDGTSSNSDIESADQEIIDEINKAGYPTKKSRTISDKSKSSKYSIGTKIECNRINSRNIMKKVVIYDLRLELDKLNLLKNKHIPNEYLFGSYEQRLALIQGLLDTDGSISKEGTVEFSSSIDLLSEQFCHLVRSLGIKTKVKTTRSFLNGKRHKNRHRVTFTTKLPIFRLNRKLERIREDKAQIGRTSERFIVSIEAIPSIPMRCITVDSPSHLFLITKSFIPTHNTMTITSVLKQASLKGYTCLYTTLSDIVAVLLGPDGEDRYAARRELMSVDFLVIDEFDSRFMQTENASDLFGRTLESIFRTRSQNKLPTLMATNSPNIVESFTGPIKQSIDSLMKGYVKTVIVLGEDFRKAKKP